MSVLVTMVMVDIYGWIIESSYIPSYLLVISSNKSLLLLPSSTMDRLYLEIITELDDGQTMRRHIPSTAEYLRVRTELDDGQTMHHYLEAGRRRPVG